jgi:hypothetical protein
MSISRSSIGGTIVAFAAALGMAALMSNAAVVNVQAQSGDIPTFELDKSFPKPLPNDLILGNIASIAVDRRDHVWIIHRPSTVPKAELTGGKKIAPPIVEFDPQGNFVRAFGGPGQGYTWMEGGFEAPFGVGSEAEHGIHVDHQNNVWVAGNGHLVLKFSREGKFLMQLGELWMRGGSNDTKLFGNPTDMAVHPDTNEVFVSDGYLNKRVIVFDATTGAYKRHWGAYGKKPSDARPVVFRPDAPLPTQFWAVHCIAVARDGMVYVCDRQRNRVQVFQKDGTYVNEVVVNKDASADREGPTGGSGSVFRVGFSGDPEQRYLYVGDNSSGKFWILGRKDLRVLGSTDSGRGNHHMTGADSKGNIYGTGGRSPRRLLFKAPSTSSSAAAR